MKKIIKNNKSDNKKPIDTTWGYRKKGERPTQEEMIKMIEHFKKTRLSYFFKN